MKFSKQLGYNYIMLSVAYKILLLIVTIINYNKI